MALVLYVLFISVVVIARMLIHHRMTGDYGLRITGLNASIHHLLAAVLLIMSVLTTFSMTVVDALELLQVQPSMVASVAGLTIGCLGITLIVIAQKQMGASWRIGVDDQEKIELITGGLYSYCRNPIYTGFILFGLGLLILIPHPYMFWGVAAGYVSIFLQVKYVEEPYLLHLHGEKFADYMHNTNRFLPGLFKHNK